MTNPIDNAVAGTVFVCILSLAFILAIIDGALPILWKIVVCSLSGLLIWAGINVMRQQASKAKKFMIGDGGNKEDLR